MSTRFHKSLWVVLVAAGSFGCADEEGSSTPRSADPSYVRVVSVAPVQGSFDPPVLPCDGRLLVHAETNWRLAPPGTCGGTKECGHLLLRVTGPSEELRVRTATASCSNDVCSTTALVELSSPEAWVGNVAVDVELALDNGNAALNWDGQPVRGGIVLELLPPAGCEAASDGAAGAPATE